MNYYHLGYKIASERNALDLDVYGTGAKNKISSWGAIFIKHSTCIRAQTTKSIKQGTFFH